MFVGKEYDWKLIGKVEKLKKYEKVAMFSVRTERDGFIPCKTFNKAIIDMLVEGQEILVENFSLKRNKWVNQEGVAKFETDVIVNQIMLVNDVEEQEFVDISQNNEYIEFDNKDSVVEELEKILND